MTSPITFSRVVALALPAAAASAATPLLGLIDAVALGRSPDPLEVGAVGLAGAVFSALYWTFGFLRMSTSGLAAQATGEGSEGAVRAVLARSVLLGALIGLALLALRPLIETIAFAGLRIESEASEATFAAALEYFGIRLWAAPAALATYAATGWLTGRGHTGVVLAATLAMTSLNAGLDWWFVAVRNEGAAGVALGTAIAEAAGLGFTALGCLWVAARKGGAFHHWRGALRADPAAFAKLFAMNRDVFIRTALLVFSFVFFTQRSSSWGDVTLAANQILLQLFLLTGLALDGPAIAAESLVGQAVGRGDRAAFDRTLKYAAWATALAALPFALAYLALGDLILSLMTTSEPIRAEAGAHLAWVALSPLAVALAFLLDGIFIGATRGNDLRDMMIASFAVYMALWFALAPAFGNHGHWAAFILYFAVRGATLLYRLPAARADAFGGKTANA